MSVFIHVKLDPTQLTPQISEALVQLCPVDIFVMTENGISVAEANEDECTLCKLCLREAPAGAIMIYKLYKDETLVSTGS